MAEHDMRKNLLDASSKIKTDARKAKADQDRAAKRMNDAAVNYEKDLRRNEKIQQANLLKNGTLQRNTTKS